MASGFSYDWNWAEQAESEEAQLLARSELFEREPQLEALFVILQAPFDGAPDFEPPLGAAAPAGFEEAPLGAGPLACALLNAFDAKPWAEWVIGRIDPDSRASAALEALEQMGKAWGPLCSLPEPALRMALEWARGDGGSRQFFSEALVALFQPFDDRPARLEERARAPACALLLSFGADPAGRSPEGCSPLSGVNALLSEAALGMADPGRIDDLLACAALLLDAGAPPSSVREEPPFSRIVPNPDLRDLLAAREEGASLRQAIEPTLSAPKPIPKRL